jgi:hypothetical protein
MSARFTVARPGRCGGAHKRLKVPAFRAPGTALAVQVTQVRVRDNRAEVAMKSILDRSFRYTNSVDTDLRKTFARIRREQRLRARCEHGGGAGKVFPIAERKRAATS